MSRLVDLSTLLSSDQLTQTKLADESGVILDVDTLQVFALNETGMFLVESLKQGTTTREALVEQMVDAFEVDGKTAVEDVDLFIDELVTHLIDRRRKP